MERFEKIGGAYSRDGIAKERQQKNLCRKKLDLYSSDKEFIFNLMFDLSGAYDCFQVKVSTSDRHGVYFGQCSFTNESSLGDAWARFESHPKVWATISDDEFCEAFKGKIRSYKN